MIPKPPYPVAVLPRQLLMTYTDPTDLRVLYNIEVDFATQVLVVGNPWNGAYEWVIYWSDTLWHSDSGYGDPAAALRDGLIAYSRETRTETENKLTVRVVECKGEYNKYWRYLDRAREV